MIEGQMVLMDAAIEVKADSLRRGSRLTIGFRRTPTLLIVVYRRPPLHVGNGGPVPGRAPRPAPRGRALAGFDRAASPVRRPVALSGSRARGTARKSGSAATAAAPRSRRTGLSALVAQCLRTRAAAAATSPCYSASRSSGDSRTEEPPHRP